VKKRSAARLCSAKIVDAHPKAATSAQRTDLHIAIQNRRCDAIKEMLTDDRYMGVHCGQLRWPIAHGSDA
jgi:hypothetical protein